MSLWQLGSAGRSHLHALVLSATLAGLLGCVPGVGSTPPAAEASRVQAPADSAAIAAASAEPPIVRVRAHPTTVTVVGWAPEESAYGLSARVRRSDGALLGYQRGDHTLYLSTIYVSNMGIAGHATIEPGAPLVRLGPRADEDACRGGPPCSPMHIVGLSIPDALLREKRDSLVVTFSSGHLRTLTLRPDVVDAYLGAVDSVVAAVRRQ